MSYVNKDEFLKFSGLDLEVEFANGNFDIDEMPQVFINRVEDNAIAILKNNYDNEDFENKVNMFLDEFKKGMCYQILEKLKRYRNNDLTEEEREQVERSKRILKKYNAIWVD